MIHINDRLDEMVNHNRTIVEIVPYDLMRNDITFYNYFKANNEE